MSPRLALVRTGCDLPGDAACTATATACFAAAPGTTTPGGVYLNCGTWGIWYSDLTSGIVYPAFDKRQTSNSPLAALAPDAALLAYGNELWRLEPRAAAQRVRGPARRVDRGSQPSRPASLGSVGLFSAASATGSWRTDGTPAGTVALPSRSVPVLAQRGRVLANNQRGPSEPLWASDGTAAAPLQVTPPGVTVTSPVQPLGADRVWFRAADATFGTEPCPPAFVRVLDVPGSSALLGVQVVLQAVLAAPNRLELPPGVLLRLGR